MLKYDLNNIHEWPLPAKAIIISIACLLVLYFSYSLDFTNLRKQLTAAQAQETDLKLQLEMLFKKEAEVSQYMTQHDELQKKLNEWQGKLVKQPALPELLNEILKAGSASGIQFSLFNPDKEANEADYFKTPIKVIATGSYHQIANFISRVANLMPIVVVNGVTLTKSQPTSATSAQTNALTAEMILEVYYLNGNPPNEDKK